MCHSKTHAANRAQIMQHVYQKYPYSYSKRSSQVNMVYLLAGPGILSASGEWTQLSRVTLGSPCSVLARDHVRHRKIMNPSFSSSLSSVFRNTPSTRRQCFETRCGISKPPPIPPDWLVVVLPHQSRPPAISPSFRAFGRVSAKGSRTQLEPRMRVGRRDGALSAGASDVQTFPDSLISTLPPSCKCMLETGSREPCWDVLE